MRFEKHFSCSLFPIILCLWIASAATSQAQDTSNQAGLGAEKGARLDFGDAPVGYGTLLASNGARHTLGSGLFLGASVDAENDGAPSTAADGDDLADTDDEDGVSVTAMEPGAQVTFDVVASGLGLFHLWIDWNQDGDWNDDDEDIFDNPLALFPGSNAVTFTVPPAALGGSTYARARLSSLELVAPFGPAPDGEVEDYRVMVLPPGSSIFDDDFENGSMSEWTSEK
jgi:hypothetical protein